MSDKPFRVFDEDDEKEFKAQVAAEPELWHIYATALDPTVKIENDVFPRPHEVYNCTSCRYGGPNISANKERFYNRCANTKARTFGMWCEGKRWNDTGCPWFDSKIKRPPHGYLPGVEDGKYGTNDRK
jgi:hypothetical protein